MLSSSMYVPRLGLGVRGMSRLVLRDYKLGEPELDARVAALLTLNRLKLAEYANSKGMNVPLSPGRIQMTDLAKSLVRAGLDKDMPGVPTFSPAVAWLMMNHTLTELRYLLSDFDIPQRLPNRGMSKLETAEALVSHLGPDNVQALVPKERERSYTFNRTSLNSEERLAAARIAQRYRKADILELMSQHRVPIKAKDRDVVVRGSVDLARSGYRVETGHEGAWLNNMPLPLLDLSLPSVHSGLNSLRISHPSLPEEIKRELGYLRDQKERDEAIRLAQELVILRRVELNTMARGLLRYLLAPGDPLQAVGQGQRTVNVRAELACRLAVLKATGHAHPSWVMTVTHSFCEPAAEGKGALPALTAS